jgi:hypothetical protein
MLVKWSPTEYNPLLKDGDSANLPNIIFLEHCIVISKLIKLVAVP